MDLIQHETLLKRLESCYGIKGKPLNWLESYLLNRSCKVKIKDTCSKSTHLKTGAPQGSLLAPTLFILYLLPITEFLEREKIKFSLYADDLICYTSMDPKNLDSYNQKKQKLQDSLSKLKSLMTANSLKLNEGKTNLIVIGKKKIKNIKCDHSILFAGSSIKPQEKIKILGVTIDSNMTFNDQTSNIIKKGYGTLKLLYNIRNILNKKQSEILIHSLISSTIDYCNILLCSTTKSNINKLQKLQNAMCRYITKTRKFDHISKDLESLHWLKIKERIDYKLLLTIYKIRNNRAPEYLNTLIKLPLNTKETRATGKNKLFVPHANSINEMKDIKFMGPTLWNKLPESSKNTLKINTFKKELKTILFKKSHDTVTNSVKT